jgi:hypothetical protein
MVSTFCLCLLHGSLCLDTGLAALTFAFPAQVNTIADAIRDEFPHVAVSTLAYDYGEQPPAVTKPRDNVQVRLCTGSMNFAQPITHESNDAFRNIVDGWRHGANTTDLALWDYVVDSAQPVQMYPNYLVLAPNVQYWAKLGVKYYYAEGPGTGPVKDGYPIGPGAGTDMEEFKDYVLASMMWQPQANASELIDEFLRGYYGSAAPHVLAFVERIQTAAQVSGERLAMHTNLPQTWKDDGPAFLNASNFETLLLANADFEAAFATAAQGEQPGANESMSRLRRAYQAVLWPTLWRWDELRSFAQKQGLAWPLPATKDEAFDDFARTFNETGTAGLVYNNYCACPDFVHAQPSPLYSAVVFRADIELGILSLNVLARARWCQTASPRRVCTAVH